MILGAVDRDGVHAEAEFGCNRTVPVALADETQDFQLPRGQSMFALPFQRRRSGQFWIRARFLRPPLS